MNMGNGSGHFAPLLPHETITALNVKYLRQHFNWKATQFSIGLLFWLTLAKLLTDTNIASNDILPPVVHIGNVVRPGRV